MSPLEHGARQRPNGDAMLGRLHPRGPRRLFHGVRDRITHARVRAGHCADASIAPSAEPPSGKTGGSANDALPIAGGLLRSRQRAAAGDHPVSGAPERSGGHRCGLGLKTTRPAFELPPTNPADRRIRPAAVGAGRNPGVAEERAGRIRATDILPPGCACGNLVEELSRCNREPSGIHAQIWSCACGANSPTGSSPGAPLRVNILLRGRSDCPRFTRQGASRIRSSSDERRSRVGLRCSITTGHPPREIGGSPTREAL